MDRDIILLPIARSYAWLYDFCHQRFGINLRGLTFILRRLRRDHFFEIHGRKMYFNHKCAGAYARMLGGCWNEHETHVFLKTLIEGSGETVTFIDVGANVGEMLVDVAGYKNVGAVIAFEPQTECSNAIEHTIQVNGYRNITLHKSAVSDLTGFVHFEINEGLPQVSQITDNTTTGAEVPCVTLDSALSGCSGSCVLLIDAEGAELKVLKGAKEFLARAAPIVIFEYHKSVLSLDILQIIFGKEVSIYRLRRDGRLDKEIEKAWNCVAIPKSAPLAAACKDIIIGSN